MSYAMTFYHHQGKEYDDKKLNIIGFNVIPVLTFLEGLPWDDYTLGWVHSLRPSCIRVSNGCVTCDCWTWRVTVYVNEDNTIRKIEQEVQVAGGTGYELNQLLPERNLDLLFDQLGIKKGSPKAPS